MEKKFMHLDFVKDLYEDIFTIWDLKTDKDLKLIAALYVALCLVHGIEQNEISEDVFDTIALHLLEFVNTEKTPTVEDFIQFLNNYTNVVILF